MYSLWWVRNLSNLNIWFLYQCLQVRILWYGRSNPYTLTKASSGPHIQHKFWRLRLRTRKFIFHQHERTRSRLLHYSSWLGFRKEGCYVHPLPMTSGHLCFLQAPYGSRWSSSTVIQRENLIITSYSSSQLNDYLKHTKPNNLSCKYAQMERPNSSQFCCSLYIFLIAQREQRTEIIFQS